MELLERLAHSISILLTKSMHLLTANNLTAIATVLAALATLYTVLLIQQQNRAAYRPVLKISSKYFWGVPSMSSIKAPVFWSDKENQCEIDQGVVHNFSLEIFNIGFASARDVVIEWHIPLSEIAHMINGIIESEYYIESDYSGFKLLKNGKAIEETCVIPEKKFEIDFIIPCKDSKDPSHIPLPYGYRKIIGLWIYYSYVNSQKIPECKEIEMSLDWKDISGKKHHALFGINIKIDMIQGKAEKIHAYIDVNEKMA